MDKQACKLRHIALSVPDVAAAQKFFEEAFGMTKAGNAQNGVHMTDGIMNVALLAKGGKFEDGVYTWTDAQGRKHNQDAAEATGAEAFPTKAQLDQCKYSLEI